MSDPDEELAQKIQQEWIVPLSERELKAYDMLAKEYELNRKKGKTNG